MLYGGLLQKTTGVEAKATAVKAKATAVEAKGKPLKQQAWKMLNVGG
jgi:hypothetical protein